MLKYRIFIAAAIGFGFAAFVFLVLMSLRSDLAVGMIGITLLMPGISLLGILLHDCCQSPIPMLATNGLIYSLAIFIFVWLVTKGQLMEGLRRAAVRCVLVVMVLIGVGWGSARVLELAWSAPSDEALVKRFSQHRSELEALVAMAKTDSLVSRVADDFIWPTDSVEWPRRESERGISPERWEQYRKLFRNLKLAAGLSKDNRGNMYFISHTEGTVVHGASKGFVYCEKTGISESRFLPCSEQHEYGRSESAKGEGSEYHRLAEHWYIYTDWD